MAASDYLKSFRQKGYSGNMSESSEKPSESDDKDQENSTTRIVKLNDDERKIFEKTPSGEDVACEVHATYENGKLNIMSVAPLGGGDQPPDDEASMAGQVAQRVMPGMQMQ